MPMPKIEGLPQSSHEDADLRAAGRVIRLAREALASLSAGLDGSFSRALDLLAGVRGRVVVSGMGKSGHIGRKIAATLSSTGTPAQFVHPAEASHGDMGILTSSDALIMLSNSGDTKDLADLITYAKRFGIPLIGIASNPASALLMAADVALVLPKAQEACSIGMAPTTSTTLTLVLGDALAVALMERKGFSADQYRELHPGGALGRALVRVSDLMHSGDSLPLVSPDTVMRDVLITMTAGGNDLRIKLREIWQLNKMDKELTGYLGQDLVTQLEELTDPKYRASHALAELPSAATGKGQKRKALAAVVGKQKKGERFAGMVPGTT